MPQLPGLSPWQRHVKGWKDCQRCHLCSGRKRVVLARGNVPADVVFIGEAPGMSEDVLGQPFMGPAGKLLDRIVEQALPSHVTRAFTNLVACIPKEEDGTKSVEPDREAIKTCQPRLVEFVQLCKPRMVVLVGSLAHIHVYGQSLFSKLPDHSLDWLPAGQEFLVFTQIVHPAAILRANLAQRGLSIQRCVVRIRSDWEQLSNPTPF